MNTILTVMLIVLFGIAAFHVAGILIKLIWNSAPAILVILFTLWYLAHTNQLL